MDKADDKLPPSSQQLCSGEGEGHVSSLGAVGDTGIAGNREFGMLQDMLHGKTVVVHGGTWTAEAREPDRRRRLHQQLCLARKLRSIMEDAAEQAEAAPTQQEARELLIRNMPNMESLVALTQAVRGGYTLDSYRSTAVLDREQHRQNELEKAKSVLQNHVQAMRNARPPEVSRPSADYADNNPPLSTDEDSKLPASKRQRKQHMFSTPHSTNDPYWSAQGTNSLPTAAADIGMEKSKKRKGIKEEPEWSDSYSKDSDAFGGRVQRRNVVPRRCHDCKSSSSYFRCCHYWFMNGTRCGKIFCQKCLESKYDESPLDWDVVTDDTDWHCPSCVGICLCLPCEKKRKKENRIALAQSDRRSMSRLTATQSPDP